MTTPKELFEMALSLQQDEELAIPFETKKQQNSVRVALYRAKDSFGELGKDISISQRDNEIVLSKRKKRDYGKYDLTFSISKRKEVEKEETFSVRRTPSVSASARKQKPGQAEVDALEEERESLHSIMREKILSIPESERQTVINDPESEVFSLQTKLNILVNRIKALRELYGIPVVRVSATEEELERFEREFHMEQERERQAAEELAASLEC